LAYDHDKKVPMYGFGGKPKMPNLSSEKTLHCFPLNGNVNDPEVDGMNGILSSYKYAIQNSIFSGPTLFAPLINETINVA